MLPTCARWTAMTRFFVLSRMTRNTSRSSSWMKRLATQNASSGDVMCVVSSATSGSRTSWRIRVISTSVVSFMEKLLSRVGCSPTRCRPVDGNVASVARRRKGDRRERSKKADSAPGRRLPKPASEKLCFEPKRGGRQGTAAAFFDDPCADEERARVRKQDGLRSLSIRQSGAALFHAFIYGILSD